MKGRNTTITIYDYKIPSWNTLYSGVHWSKRGKLAQEIHFIVRAVLDPEFEPFDGQVDIEVVGYFKTDPLDPDNICAKAIIDGLKGWYLTDDTMDYINSVTTRSEIDTLSPRIVVTITQVSDDFKFRCTCCDKAWPSKKLLKNHMRNLCGQNSIE